MSGEESGEKTSPKRLYVGNLSFATTDESLKGLFDQAGEVATATVIRNRGGKSRGFGIVEFAEEEGAQAAVAKFHEQAFEGRNLLVRVDEPKRSNRPPIQETPSAKIYVGNLPFSVTSEKLGEVFPGNIKAEVVQDRRNGRSRGFGTVEFKTVEDAQAAIDAHDQKDCEGRSMRVRFDRRGERK